MSEGENKFLKLARNILKEKPFARQIIMKQIPEESIIMRNAGDRQHPELSASARGDSVPVGNSPVCPEMHAIHQYTDAHSTF